MTPSCFQSLQGDIVSHEIGELTLSTHRCRHALPACAKSQRIGRANCLRGELSRTMAWRSGMAPARAASSCRDLLRRHRLNSALTAWFWISCKVRSVSAVRRRRSESTYCTHASAVRLGQHADEHLDCPGVLQDLEGGRQHRDVLDRLEQDGEKIRLEQVGGTDESCDHRDVSAPPLRE